MKIENYSFGKVIVLVKRGVLSLEPFRKLTN